MIIGIPREVHEGERRVAATPDTVSRLIELGFDVLVEQNAGTAATFLDAAYEEVGARIALDAGVLWGEADLVLKVRPPEHASALGCHELELMREGGHLIGFLWPDQNPDVIEHLRKRKATALAVERIPRISRAQKMDALSSLANIAGYRAVLEGAHHFGSFFTGQITAAGRIRPATVLVIGAGVAGLQAIATAKALGAVVRAFDTRPAVADQVKSLGGEFLELEFEESGEGKGGYAKVMSKAFIDAEMALFAAQAPEVDIVITTALIPGRPAPKLWTTDMVEAMKPGSVVVDLAAEQGGNCDLTVPGEVVVHKGSTVVGYTDLTSRLATTASQLYGTNLVHLLSDMGGGESYRLDHNDEVVRGALVVQDGEVLPPPPPKPASDAAPTKRPAPPRPATKVPAADAKPAKTGASQGGNLGWIVAGALALGWLGLRMSPAAGGTLDPALASFLQHLTVFVLACFVGWQVIWSVTAALHTPLMSVTNAISGIIIVGGMLHTSAGIGTAEGALALAAVFFAMINVAGGFLVTERMLRMFRKG